jgi:hypothetical protein
VRRKDRIFVTVIIVGILAFEIFNYSTTEYALSDLLGNLSFFRIQWSTILAIAFCAIDIAGFSQMKHLQETNHHNEIWYLIGAWLLAVSMNAILTCWAMSIGIKQQPYLPLIGYVSNTGMILIPEIVAVITWLIRILLIGSLSMIGTQRHPQIHQFH